MKRSFVLVFFLLCVQILNPTSYGQQISDVSLKGDVLSSDPSIDGIAEFLWDDVPVAETQFLFSDINVPISIRFAYYKSSLYVLFQIHDQLSIQNNSNFQILFDLDESSSKSSGDLIVEISLYVSSNNITVSRVLESGVLNSTVNPPFASTKVQYDTDIWNGELQLVTFNDIDTFRARETLFTVMSYTRVLNNTTQSDSAFDQIENEDLIQTGTWSDKEPIVFPPLDAIIDVFHSGIERITSGETLVKIITYISIGTSGPIEDIKIILRSPLPIQAFTGISSEIIANSLLQRYSITVTANSAPDGGIIRLTYFLNTENRTSDVLVWEPLNISYVNTVNQFKSVLVGEEVVLDFASRKNSIGRENATSLLSKYNITVVEEDFSLMDFIFPPPVRLIALRLVGIFIIVFGLNIFRSWWTTAKNLEKFRRKGELLLLNIIQTVAEENPDLAKSFARRTFLDLKDSLNRATYKVRFRAARLEDLSFHWTEFLYQVEKRVKVYYSFHPNYGALISTIYSNFDLFNEELSSN